MHDNVACLHWPSLRVSFLVFMFYGGGCSVRCMSSEERHGSEVSLGPWGRSMAERLVIAPSILVLLEANISNSRSVEVIDL